MVAFSSIVVLSVVFCVIDIIKDAYDSIAFDVTDIIKDTHEEVSGIDTVGLHITNMDTYCRNSAIREPSWFHNCA